MVGDTLLAALIAVFDLLIFVSRVANPEVEPHPRPWYVTLPVLAAAVLPMVFRRRFPVTVAYLVLGAGIAHSVLEIGVASMITACVSLYTLVAYVSRKAALLYLGAN